MKTVELFTDGACLGNPGPGGWACILKYNSTEMICFGGEKDTTNNRMELMAVIEGLKNLNEKCIVNIYSDSQYVVNSMRLGWARQWQKNNWKKSDKKPALNADLWNLILELDNKHMCEYFWVRGHNGHEYNERCDELAVKMANIHSKLI
jgi:ribonuclease HI